MQTIKILVPVHTLPSSKNVITNFFASYIPYLETKFNVHIIWLVYTPDKFLETKSIKNNEIILDIHNYKNAIEVLDDTKPDLIFASPDWNFINYAFSSAANFLNIPVFFMVHTKAPQRALQNNLKNSLRFFETTTPSDNDSSKKIFMKRGRFFLYKYIFLLKTKLELRENIFDTLFGIWKYILTDSMNSKYALNTIQFLENESLRLEQLKLGFKNKNLIVTGNPIYDHISELENQINSKTNSKINILFAPSTLFEHGFWTEKQQNSLISQIVKKITAKKTDYNLSIKFHPSSTIFSKYKKLVESIDSEIPIFQKGTIEDYLSNVDVIISSQSSSAEFFALLFKKRIVICDFFDSTDDVLVKDGVAVMCKHPDDLYESINQSLKFTTYEKNRQNFIEKYLYKLDGNASKRITEHLSKTLTKNN